MITHHIQNATYSDIQNIDSPVYSYLSKGNRKHGVWDQLYTNLPARLLWQSGGVSAMNMCLKDSLRDTVELLDE